MFLTYDISSTLTWFINQVLRIASFGFSLLESFTFFGFTLLDFILCLGILAVLISIVLPHLQMAGERADARISEFRTKHHFW